MMQTPIWKIRCIYGKRTEETPPGDLRTQIVIQIKTVGQCDLRASRVRHSKRSRGAETSKARRWIDFRQVTCDDMPVRGDHLGKMEAGIQPTCAPPSPVAQDLPTA